MSKQNIKLDEIANSLNDYRQRLLEDRAKIDSEIKRVETQIAGLNGNKNYQLPQKRRRRPRGANKDTVEQALISRSQNMFSVGELADLVELQASSVRYALKQLDEEGVVKEVKTGYWQAIPKSIV
jgi:ribosomal protein S25